MKKRLFYSLNLDDDLWFSKDKKIIDIKIKGSKSSTLTFYNKRKMMKYLKSHQEYNFYVAVGLRAKSSNKKNGFILKNYVEFKQIP